MVQTAAAQRAIVKKGELSNERLLEIAAMLFRDRGYASTTMRDIAQAANMKAGSLYYHFDSKDEILDLVLSRGISEAIRGFEEAQAALPEGAPFEKRLRAAIVAHLQTTSEFGTYTVASRQLLKSIPDDIRKKHMAMRQEYDALWYQLIEAGRAQGVVLPKKNLGIMRLFIFGAINWSTEWVDPKRKSLDELGDIACDLFLNGLKH